MNQVSLKGTEKQISWATEIRRKAMAGVEVVKAEMRTYLHDECGHLGEKCIDDLLAFYEEGVNAILVNDSAAFWIDNRWIELWADLKAGTPLARSDASAFIHKHNQQNGALYKEIILRAKFEEDLVAAREAAKGSIKSQEEWDAAKSAFAKRFGQGTRFETLDVKASTEILDGPDNCEYRSLLVEYAGASFAMRDFVQRSGACERLRVCHDD